MGVGGTLVQASLDHLPSLGPDSKFHGSRYNQIEKALVAGIGDHCDSHTCIQGKEKKWPSVRVEVLLYARSQNGFPLLETSAFVRLGFNI